MVFCNILPIVVEESKFMWLFMENTEGLSRSSAFSQFVSIPYLLAYPPVL